MRKILITGATGKIGMRFIANLSKSLEDWHIVIDTRNPASDKVKFIQKLSPFPVEAITLNLKEKTKVEALNNLTDLFVIAPFSTQMDKWHQDLIDLLQYNALSPKTIKVSVTGAKNPKEYTETGQVPGQHWLGEQMLRDTGWQTVSIRPNIFMQHFMMNTGLYSKGDHAFYLPFENTKVSWIDCHDISYCAHVLFSNSEKFEKYNHKAFELSGQTTVSPEEMQIALSLLKGKEVKHYATFEEFTKHCEDLGISDGIKHFYKEAGEGWFSVVNTSEFEDITGFKPNNFAQFLLENQEWFK